MATDGVKIIDGDRVHDFLFVPILINKTSSAKHAEKEWEKY